MNRVGREGRGESVWMGFFLSRVIDDFLPLCERRGDRSVPPISRVPRAARDALNDSGWDGDWYRRGFYDGGEPLGSQLFRRMPDRRPRPGLGGHLGRGARRSRRPRDRPVERQLISDADGLIRLLTPAFEKTPNDPGYIKGYVPGVRENGGQYTHAALWVIRAVAELSRNDRAAGLLEMLNPSTSRTAEQVAVYQVEPYVVAADVYGEAPHVGRGGWTWYTGSAGWMYRVAIESILGFQWIGGEALSLHPCIPDDWPGFTFSFRLPGSRPATTSGSTIRMAEPAPREAYESTVPRPSSEWRCMDPLAHDGRAHRVEIVLGPEGDC